MIRIFYDHQIFSSQKMGGISRYFAELKSNLTTAESTTSNQKYISDNFYLKQKYEYLNAKQFHGKKKCYSYINQAVDFAEYISSKYNIFHPTYYYPNSFLSSLSKKKVITVYDLIHEKFSHIFPDAQSITQQKIKLLNDYDLILAISEHTKRDLMTVFNIPESKIRVTYLASSITKDSPSSHINLPEKFILFVGTRGLYKNFSRLASAVSEVIKKEKLFIFCAGGGALSYEELTHLEALGIKDLVIQKDITDSQLTLCYRKALLFVFPSEYEGFGIPVLESFENDCPTLLSNKSCFPEIAQDSAFYFDKFDEVGPLIERLVLDDHFRTSRIRLQQLRRSDFSWIKTSHETLKCYKELL